MVQETGRINFETNNLDIVEGRIKAIGGAINVLGGSVEVVVGSMGLIGIDEKVSKQFQEAATSAIAFADGAKRVFEGYKELREASELFRKAQTAATAATALNTTATTANNAAQTASVGILGKVRAGFIALTQAIKANPFAAAALAIGTLVTALIAYRAAQDDANESAQEFKDILGIATQEMERQFLLDEKNIANAKLRGASQKEINALVEKQSNTQKSMREQAKQDIINEQTRLQNQLNGLSKTSEEYEKIDAQIKALEKDRITISNQITKAEIDNINKILEARKPKETEKEKTPEEKFKDELSALNKKYDEEEGLLLKRQLLGENVDTAILESQQKRFDASIKLMEKYNMTDKNIIQQEIDRRQKAEDEKTRIQKEAEEKRKADVEKGFQFMLQNVDKHYKQQLTLLRKQNLTKEQFEEKSKQLEAERLNNQLALYKLYGKDVTDIQEQIAQNSQTFTEEELSNLTEFFQSETAKRLSGVLSAVSSITSGFLSMAQENSDARLNQIEADYNSRMQGLVGTDEEISAQQEAIEAEKNRAMEAERRRAFEDQKKLRIANTITSGISSAFEAFAGAMQLGPILGPIVGSALSAMILAQMGSTVKNIQTQSYTGGSPSIGGGGMRASSVGGYNISNVGGGFSGGGAPMTGGGGGGGFSGNMSAPNPQNNSLPIRAYVVSNDVSNGLDAQADIDSRRKI